MMKLINKLFKRTDMTKSSSDENSNNDRVLDIIEKRNLVQFGDPQGPSVDQLQALGKSSEQIIVSSCVVASEEIEFVPEKMNELKPHYDKSKCVFYILFEEDSSAFSYVNIFYACIKAKYPIEGVDGLKILSAEYLLIAKLGEYSLSLDWHYAVGLTLRAETPESNDIVTEIAHYINAEIKELVTKRKARD